MTDLQGQLVERTPEAKQACHDGYCAGLAASERLVRATGAIAVADRLYDMQAIQIEVWSGMTNV